MLYRSHIISLFLIFISRTSAFAQNKSDELINSVLSTSATDDDQGLQLIKDKNYSAANLYFSDEISKNEDDREAYFKRGVASWALSDTVNACRDWSAVLAMGDTVMFNLLDSKCHGSMLVDDDTIPSKTYHALWKSNSTSSKSAMETSKTVVEEMPEFPGGTSKMLEYIKENKKPADNTIHGTVYVNFLISPKGKIKYPYIARSLNKITDRDAIRLVREMPEWKPGKNKGKAVFVRSSIPVRY